MAKSYIKVGLILAIITSVCAILIALLNTVTAPIITENAEKKEQNTLSLIYEGATFTALDLDIADEAIEKVYKAEVDGALVGYVYLVKGKNAYGTIELMVGITDGKTKKVEVMTNTESFKKNVNTFIDDKIKEQDITTENVGDIDVKCGATYGAKLTQSLIESALKHYEGGLQ